MRREGTTVFPVARVHMMGIGGVGMSGVARMLLHDGLKVTGSDMKESPVLDILRDMGADVKIGQSGENIPDDTEMVIISAAIGEENPELSEARSRGVEVVKYAGALGMLMVDKRGIAVAGTHGKSTTSAMLAWICTVAGQAPSFVVGAMVPDLGTSSREGNGDIFVAEACEYDRSFLNLQPRIAIITNIEEDHLDYYRDLDEIVGAFREFSGLLPRDGLLVANAHDRNAVAVARESRAQAETFGTLPEADWQAEELHAENGRYSFTVSYRGAKLGRIALSIPGMHNVFNALAACAAADAVAVDFESIRKALESFRGAARRFEVVGKEKGVTVIDDYAHHPTEIQATLQAARDCVKDGKLWVIFQPHQHSRTRFFLKDFARSFSQADRVIVPDIYFVRDSQDESRAVNALDLVNELTGLSYDAEYITEWDAIVERVVAGVNYGDVVMTMGAGNVYEVAYALVERLRRYPD